MINYYNYLLSPKILFFIKLNQIDILCFFLLFVFSLIFFYYLNKSVIYNNLEIYLKISNIVINIL